jgi:PAS domain S-box-containing protein
MLTQVRSDHAKMEETNRNLEAIVNERTRELQRSERKYRSFLEQAGAGILVWDPESLRIVEANARAGELFGDVPAKLLNGSVDELFAARDRARRSDELSEINEQGTVLLNDVDLEQRHGGSFPAEIEASLVRFGNETLVLGMFRDLTETRALERREVLLNEKVSRSERMASIGQLAAGVAHEINNPMSYMASNVNRLVDFSKLLAEITEQSLAPGAALDRLAEINGIVADLQEIAADTSEGVARVTEIVTALREFSHGGRADAGYEWVDINRVIRNCLTLVRNDIKERATVHLELQPLPRILCNATQIGQVLMNLLSNAAQAMDNHGVILVTSCSGGDRVHLAVEDNGRGIPPDELPKIFDPFFTTKSLGHGTGLGLSVSHEIIRRHGGALWVDSRVGHGTRFLIELLRDGPPEDGMLDEDSPAAAEDAPEPC